MNFKFLVSPMSYGTGSFIPLNSEFVNDQRRAKEDRDTTVIDHFGINIILRLLCGSRVVKKALGILGLDLIRLINIMIKEIKIMEGLNLEF